MNSSIRQIKLSKQTEIKLLRNTQHSQNISGKQDFCYFEPSKHTHTPETGWGNKSSKEILLSKKQSIFGFSQKINVCEETVTLFSEHKESWTDNTHIWLFIFLDFNLFSVTWAESWMRSDWQPSVESDVRRVEALRSPRHADGFKKSLQPQGREGEIQGDRSEIWVITWLARSPWK